MKLTIAYMTSRKNPRIQWFFDSLAAQLHAPDEVTVIVVDFWAQPLDDCLEEWTTTHVAVRRASLKDLWPGPLVHTPPKPTVWQGAYRLTSRDYFAASNARNTAIALCPTDWLACVDDLSVLLPGWLDAVRAAQAAGYIALGSYRKVKNIRIEDGQVVSFEPFPPGVDSRLKDPNVLAHERAYGVNHPVPVPGSWMFGCSFAAPVEALLKINGFDEDADSMSGEDYIAGIMLERAGYTFRYCRQMSTLEDEDAHYEEKPFLRIIKPYPGEKDASHALLNMVLHGGRNRAPNYFGEGDLAGLRQRIITGEPFPVTQVPDRDWRDGQPLREM